MSTDLDYIDKDYLRNLLISLHDNFIDSWKPKKDEIRYTVHFYGRGVDGGNGKLMFIFETPYDDSQLFFKSERETSSFCNRYYNLFKQLKQKGGWI